MNLPEFKENTNRNVVFFFLIVNLRRFNSLFLRDVPGCFRPPYEYLSKSDLPKASYSHLLSYYPLHFPVTDRYNPIFLSESKQKVIKS